MKIVKVGEQYELQILIHYRMGKQRVEKWVTKATGTKEFCENVYLCMNNE